MAKETNINYSGKFNLPIAVERLNAIPLDTTEIFATYETAHTYAISGATAYVGQIIYAQDTDLHYVIKNTAGDLEVFGDTQVIRRGYFYEAKFYKEEAHTTEITADEQKVYVDIPTGNLYTYKNNYEQVVKLYTEVGENINGTMTQKAIKEKFESLDVAEVGEDGKYIQKIKEEDGKISTTLKEFDVEINTEASDNNIPTTKAVKTYVDAETTRSTTKEAEILTALATEKKAREDGTILGEVFEGQPFNLPYFFKTAAESNKIVVTAEVISLDGKKEKREYSLDVIGASSTKAGLMTAEDKVHLDHIVDVLPGQETTTNKLADKDFVNSSIQNVAAYYITKRVGSGTEADPYKYEPFATKAELTSITTVYSGGEVRVPTRNDYCIVLADESKKNPETQEIPTTRYIYEYSGKTVPAYNPNNWEFQYIINNTGLTATQLAAVNSGITTKKREDYDAHLINTENPHQVTKAQVGLGNVDNTSDLDKPISTLTQAAIDAEKDAREKGNILGTEAVSQGPYHLPYYFSTEDLAEKITVKAHTITLDGNKTLGTYTLDVNGASTTKAGLMTATDKTNLEQAKTDIANIKNGAEIDSFADVEEKLADKVDKTTTIAGKNLQNNITKEELLTAINVADGAEVNVNADWEATSGDAQILHKPTTIAGYGITDAYTKTEADTKFVEANTTITAATKTKVTYDAQGLITAGADLEASDIPALDASKITTGTFADERIASAATWNAKQNALTFDTEPTTGSTNPVTSGGVKTAFVNLQLAQVGADGNYIDTISQTEGQISATKKAFDTSITAEATNNTAPTTLATKTYIDAETTRATTAEQTLDDKIDQEIADRESGKILGNEAVSGGPYHLPYYFNTEVGSDKIKVNAYTISLDGEKTLETYSLDVNSATNANAGLMSKDDKTKLDSIASGAEVNVQSDWSQTDNTKDDFIKNKPVVDQTFSGTSANAQSGVAINAAKVDKLNPTASGSLSLNRSQLSTVGENSVALGYATTASGAQSTALGHNTVATGADQLVFGKYNTTDANKAEVVGGGSAETQKNIRTLDWNGNEILAGKLTVGAAPTENMDVATKQYVDNTVVGKQDTLTETQLAAVNSGITAAKITAQDNAIALNTAKVSANNSEITIKKNGTSVGTFTLNQATAGEIDITDVASASALTTAQSDITTINSKIPTAATSENQLADKAFVNSSIATETANFLGTLDVVANLGLTYGASTTEITTALNNYTFTSKTNNDYCFVINKDTVNNVIYQKFKYVANNNSFLYEYTLNNSSFTQAQWDAINSGITTTSVGQITTNQTGIATINTSAPMTSGITSTKVSSYDSHLSATNNPHAVTKAQVGLGDVVNTGDSDTPIANGTTKFTTGGAYTELAKKVDKVEGKALSSNDFTTAYINAINANTAKVSNVKADWNTTDSDAESFIKNKPTLATIATSGSYNDLINTPAIPTSETVSGWGFAKTTDHDATKQDKLYAETTLEHTQNIKTINNESILASGNLDLVKVDDVINDYTHDDANKPLSASRGKDLNERINNLDARGRFLSIWNCVTGKPTTEPTSLPYAYKTGDYFVVGTVGSGYTNLRPAGSSYTGAASTTTETETVTLNNTYYYDGTNWILLKGSDITTSFGAIGGSPYDNTNLKVALDSKQATLTAGTGISITNNVISNTNRVADWDKIEGNISDNTALTTALNAKVNKNADIVAATKTKITYDSKGLVTAGSDLIASDIPSLDASKITTGQFADSMIASADTWNAKVTGNTAITGATKTKITYDSKGLVTAGEDLVASDIPSLDTSKITTGTFADERIASASSWNNKSTVAVSNTGTSTDVITYITVDGVEKKLPGNGVVDTTYSASSTNAQAGTAVAQAIAGQSIFDFPTFDADKKYILGIKPNTAGTAYELYWVEDTMVREE